MTDLGWRGLKPLASGNSQRSLLGVEKEEKEGTRDSMTFRGGLSRRVRLKNSCGNSHLYSQPLKGSAAEVTPVSKIANKRSQGAGSVCSASVRPEFEPIARMCKAGRGCMWLFPQHSEAKTGRPH